MRRRDLIGLIVSGAVVIAHDGYAQQAGRSYRLAIMSALRRDDPVYLAFLLALRPPHVAASQSLGLLIEFVGQTTQMFSRRFRPSK